MVRSAAIAMTGGVVDPIGFLAYDGIEWDIACEVMTQANKMRVEEHRAELQAMARGIGAEVSNQFARLFKS